MNLERLNEGKYPFKATFSDREVQAMRAAHTEQVNKDVRDLLEADSQVDLEQIPTESLAFTDFDKESSFTIDGLYDAAQILYNFVERTDNNIRAHITASNENFDHVNTSVVSRIWLSRVALGMANQMQATAFEAGFTAEVKEPNRELKAVDPDNNHQQDTV
jgi:hypothetical protein